MLNILQFNHYYDSKILGFIYFVGLKCTGSHWSIWPNVEFQVEFSKTNSSLAKSHFQQKTRGHAQKPPPTDVKVGRYGFVGFVNDLIDCECLRYVFCFRIKEKEKDKFYINFNLIYKIPPNVIFFFSHYFNWIIMMDM